VTANPPAVAILALHGCSRAVDGQPCEVCLFRAAKDVAAVERGGRLVVVSAEDLEVAVRMIGNEADICGEDCGSPYCRAWQHLHAALPERTSE
jgi:hypothetical protein